MVAVEVCGIAFGISGGGGVMALLSSHPPIEARIAALQAS